MRSPFIVLVTAAILLCSSAAMAFSTDDKTLNQADGSPRFSDPDDQKPATLFMNTQPSDHFGQQGGNGQYQGNVTPTAAPFSPTSHYPAARQ